MADTRNSPDIKIFGIEIRTGCKSPRMRLLFLVVILSFLLAAIIILGRYALPAIATIKLPSYFQEVIGFLKKLKSG